MGNNGRESVAVVATVESKRPNTRALEMGVSTKPDASIAGQECRLDNQVNAMTSWIGIFCFLPAKRFLSQASTQHKSWAAVLDFQLPNPHSMSDCLANLPDGATSLTLRR